MKTDQNQELSEELASWEYESRVRYRAVRRGFRVIQTRGREHGRRNRAGVGTYMLINEATNDVALSAATIRDIQVFLRTHDQAHRRHLH